MIASCKIEMLDEPIEATFEDIDTAPLNVFFALGIVNPYGPTLSFVASVGRSTNGAVLPIVRVMLNPFSQTVHQVGRFTVGEEWTPENDLEPLVALDFGSCPTLLLLGSDVPEGARHSLAAQILESFSDDVVETYRSVKAHFGDPWTRVSASNAPSDDNEQDIRQAAESMAALLVKTEHILPELSALRYAWDGSITKTGISASMKDGAFSTDAFMSFLTEKIMPCMWLPDLPPPEEPHQQKPRQPFQPKSTQEIRDTISAENWEGMSNDELLKLLQYGMELYGIEVDQADIPPLAKLYSYVIPRTDGEHRALMAQQLTNVVEQHQLSPAAFLPILVMDPEFQVVTTATIDFISSSSFTESGELYALTELRSLFKQGSLENAGAIFGAIVCMGEARFTDFLDEVRQFLTADQINIAARAHTTFLKKCSISYWLKWANELVKSDHPDSQRIFGSVASALILGLRRETTGKVFDGERDFPCTGKDKPVRIFREWTIDEYADVIAPDLYNLEATEAPPKLMSDVLREWGLKPAAALVDQHIPAAGTETGPPKKLRKPSI